MIFCFSGTGNSLYVANKLAQKINDDIIMITERELHLRKRYILKDNESVGFVFPIYWGGMPKLVEKFLVELQIDNYKEQYSYAVVTYGLLKNNGVRDLIKVLKNKKISLVSSFEVKMVDNYIVGYELADSEKQREILNRAEIKIEDIVDAVSKHQKVKVKDYLSIIKPIPHKLYKLKNHSKKFYVLDSCSGCGICEKECPCSAIEIEGNKPKWMRDCSFCLKCINRCPKEAIQYGKGTEKRIRYYNANLIKG